VASKRKAELRTSIRSDKALDIDSTLPAKKLAKDSVPPATPTIRELNICYTSR